MTTVAPSTPAPPTTPQRRKRWQRWAAYAAGAWSLAYGLLGVYWTLGGGGFPFGASNASESALSLLAGATAQTGAPIIAALGLAGAAAALAMTRVAGRGLVRAALLVFGWAMSAAALFVVCDYRLLMSVAYTPILLLGAPFGWPEGVTVADAWHWVVVNQLICAGGGLAWAAAALTYQRRSRSACGACGRGNQVAAWTRPASAARWGKVAVYVAAIIPTLYAMTRWAWALGIPLGVNEQFLHDLQDRGASMIGAALATMGVGGAILTLGLTQRWGEIFPRWIPRLAGKRVPPALAVVPAALVAILVTQAGLMFVRLAFLGVFGEGSFLGLVMSEEWAAIAPELLWPVWGLALGAATLAYYFRRRGSCGECGRA